MKAMSLFVTLGGLLLTPFIVMKLIKPATRTPAAVEQTASLNQTQNTGLDLQKAQDVQRDLAKAKDDEQKKIDQLAKQTE